MNERSCVKSDPTFVSYCRVSTKNQGESGLSLEAQENITKSFANARGTIISAFVEIESGKKKNRPELIAAIKQCKKTKSTLLISRLDRLARNLHFVTSLIESKIEFICCDNPHATRLTIQILAAVAEEEIRSISVRTKLALAAAKKRGTALGVTGKDRARENKERADGFAVAIRATVEDIRSTGKTTLTAISDGLNARKIKTVTGRKFHPMTVDRLLKRIKIS